MNSSVLFTNCTKTRREMKMLQKQRVSRPRNQPMLGFTIRTQTTDHKSSYYPFLFFLLSLPILSQTKRDSLQILLLQEIATVTATEISSFSKRFNPKTIDNVSYEWYLSWETYLVLTKLSIIRYENSVCNEIAWC